MAYAIMPSLYNGMTGRYPVIHRVNGERYTNFGTLRVPRNTNNDSEDATVRKKRYLYSV